MNKLIRELAEQATTKHTSYFDGRGNVTETYFDTEKFAQLIINKCLDVCYNTGMNSESYDGQLNVAELIKQQFGVD